jgi:hypothetical protein
MSTPAQTQHSLMPQKKETQLDAGLQMTASMRSPSMSLMHKCERDSDADVSIPSLISSLDDEAQRQAFWINPLLSILNPLLPAREGTALRCNYGELTAGIFAYFHWFGRETTCDLRHLRRHAHPTIRNTSP